MPPFLRLASCYKCFRWNTFQKTCPCLSLMVTSAQNPHCHVLHNWTYELWGACRNPFRTLKFETIFFLCQTFLLPLADEAGPRLNRASAEYIIFKFFFRFLWKINPSFGCFQTLLFLPFIVPAISHFMFTLHQPSSAVVYSSRFVFLDIFCLYDFSKIVSRILG